MPSDSGLLRAFADIKRSLILAGGGMRVAYQAGVLKAFEEAGLAFGHVDGTSGGTINTAMLFSGVTPGDMCERWRTLNVRDFVSLMPLRAYGNPLKISAMGDADGIVGKVFPHLGIDVARINQPQASEATFNVCNFSKKQNLSLPNKAVTLPHLVAGISLPIFMPAIEIDGDWYTDSVWIMDANLMEAVRRGAEELWLVWCIGNSHDYKAGAFLQYVHMIEMSANGALLETFAFIEALNERIKRGDSPYGQTQPIRLHVIKPANPLPLDPDFYLGCINGAELVNIGYQNAWRYLADRSSEGVGLNWRATTMEEPGISVVTRQCYEAETQNRRLGLQLHLRAEGSRIETDAQNLSGRSLALYADITIERVISSQPARSGLLCLSDVNNATAFTLDFDDSETRLHVKGTFEPVSLWKILVGGHPRLRLEISVNNSAFDYATILISPWMLLNVFRGVQVRDVKGMFQRLRLKRLLFARLGLVKSGIGGG